MSSNSITPLNLSNQNYFIRTTDTQNPYLGIRGLDNIVGSGVYSFIINGSSFLQRNTEVRIEAIDSDGNQILINGVKNLLRGTSRVVSFVIDERITGSSGTLYVSATLSKFRENGINQDVPLEFSDKENFLFEYNFNIDSNKINSDEIIFRKYPTVSITPLVKTVRRVSKSTSTTSNITATVKSYTYNPSKSEYILEVSTDSDEFSVDMEGGEVQITGGEIPIYGNILLTPPVQKRNAQIRLFNPDLELYDKEKFKGLIQSPITFTVTYTSITEYGGSILQQQSYADMFIQDMEVVSGDVQKIKIFTKSDTLDTDYSLNSEHDVVFKNLLEIDGVGNIGLFNSSNKLNYWNVTKIDSGVSDPSILQSDIIFLSSLTITGDYDNPSTKVVKERTLQTPRYELKSNIGLNLKKDTNYNLTLNVAVTDVPAEEDTRLDVYVSGSNLPVGCSNRFGTLIHSFRTNTDKVWDNQFDIIYNRENDVPDGELVFVTTAGKWYLQNIEFAPQIKQGFSPPEFRVQFPVQILKPNQDVDFKIQFYDGNDNKADYTLYKNNVIFNRPNIVIEGEQNVGTGSIFFGSTSGSGIQIGASGDGAIIRSIGYEGFESGSAGTGSGFLIFSGSVLPEYPDNYGGVGLELFGTTESYLRFKTDPSLFEVKTSTFFLGSNEQFISGSNGNIEISSSQFHLDPSNNIMIMSGTIQASDGIIGGFTIEDTFITSSNLELNSSGYIKTSDFVDGLKGWIITAEGNGSAQFQNVKIRGALTTTVFDKETVNAVGGQLWVANSTIFSQSVSNSTQDFPLDNVTGFQQDEILLVKKITDTGFNSEYVKVNSVTRTSPSSDTDFSGIVNVDRAYQSGLPTGSGVTWVSELASSAEDYTEGQVIVSTGKENTGWILLNASPNNTATPYIDIVERTGSGVYDYELKARLGDLGGLSQNQLLGTDPSNAGFGLYSENVFLTGTITAESGAIGNFQIIDGKISGSNMTMDANTSAIYKTDQGPGSDPQAEGFEYLADEYYIDFTPSGSNDPAGAIFYIKMGPNFMVDKDGILIASGAIFEGSITASAGFIGGFVINSSSLSSVDNKVFISGSPTTTGFFISSSNFNIKGNGDVTGSQVLFTGGKISGSNLTIDVQNFIAKGDSVEISGSNFHLLDGNVTASNVDLSGKITANSGKIGGFEITDSAITGSNFYISGSATGNDFFISSSNFNVKASGDVTGSSVLFTGGTVGGFTITDSFISSSGLIIQSDGTIQTSNFVDGLTGWFISSIGNGTAQFENVKIRGTLRTTVFEKETVNAVGGQLWVANSTTLSQSVDDSSTEFVVDNAGGFEVGEILLLKKVTDNGFSTEYVQIDAKNENTLTVERGYGALETVDPEYKWINELESDPQSYSEGQVIVSTGKVNTGYIKLNASPTDDSTPYIDIIERTGSGIYDRELKARLGDLGALTQTQLLGTNPSNAGFGLYSENVFLTGKITATGGKIGGFEITDSAITGSNFYISGSATDNEFFISSSNFNVKASGDVTGSSVLFTGGKISGSNLNIDVQNFVAKGDSVEISGSNFHLLNGNITASNADISGIISSSEGNIGGWAITTSSIEKLGVNTEGIELNSSSSKIIVRDSFPKDVVTLGNIVDSKYGIKIIEPGAGTGILFEAYGDGNATSASLAGFKFSPTQINDSGNNLILKSSGEITASNVDLSGKITATTGKLFDLDVSGSLIIGVDGKITDKNSKYFISSSGIQYNVDASNDLNPTQGDTLKFQGPLSDDDFIYIKGFYDTVGSEMGMKISGSSQSGGTTALDLLGIDSIRIGNVTGTFSVDTDTLYVDAASDRVGINKEPSTDLDLLGDFFISGSTHISSSLYLPNTTSDTSTRVLVLDTSTNKVHYNDSISGGVGSYDSLDIGNSIYSSSLNTSISDSTTGIVSTIATGSLSAVYFDYVITYPSTGTPTGRRAGTVMSTWLSGTSTIEFTDISTFDIGNTIDVIMGSDLNAGNVRLTAENNSGDTISVKTIIRSI